jgi:hypothetical protein
MHDQEAQPQMMLKWRLSAAVLLVLAAVFGCDGEPEADRQLDDAAAPVEEADGNPAASADEGAAAQKEAAAANAGAEKEAEAAALTAEDLTGTTWRAGTLTVAFQPEGRLVLTGGETGTWKVDGRQLTMSAGGVTYSAELREDDILYGDMAMERVE